MAHVRVVKRICWVVSMLVLVRNSMSYDVSKFGMSACRCVSVSGWLAQEKLFFSVGGSLGQRWGGIA